MTLEDIKTAVHNGEKVFWKNTRYSVIVRVENNEEKFLIKDGYSMDKVVGLENYVAVNSSSFFTL